MECPKCRQSLADSATACKRCGFRLRVEQLSAYEVLQPSSKPKPSLELVLAVASIPAALMPLLGFSLSVPALVIAHKHKTMLPLVLAVVGIVLSLAVLTFNLVYFAQHPKEPAATVPVNVTKHFSSGSLNSAL